MAWLTGYDGWSFYVHQCVLLAQSGEPVWFGRGQDANGAKRTVFMDHDNIIGYEDHYVQSSERHPMDRLSEIVADKGWARGAIGVEMDNYYFSAACYRSLTTHLTEAAFQDATGLVNWCRAVKSAQELAYMRQAARIVEAMHGRILEVAEPGLKKNELVAEIYRTSILGADGVGGDYPAIVPLLPTGPDAGAPHLTWDDKPLKSGEGTFFEIAGCVRRYHCPPQPHALSGHAAAGLPGGGRGADRGHRGGPGGGQAGQPVPGHREGLLRRSGARRHREDEPLRLRDRPQLPARLGRAHHEPAPGDESRFSPA